MTRRLANDRGAILLLAVYFSALILLLLGGVSLQRTNVEVRASQLSRDVQQGVFLAEAGLDRILAVFRDDPLVSDEVASRTFTLANGTVQAAVVTPGDAIQQDGSEIRRVTLTGTTSNGITQRIYAVLKLTGDGAMPFREGLTAWGGNFYAGTSGANPGILTINGPIGSTHGSSAAVMLINTKVNGPVFVGPPNAGIGHESSQQDWFFIGHAVEFWGMHLYNKGLHVDGMTGFGMSGTPVQTINAQLSAPPTMLERTASTLPQRTDLAAYDTIASCHGDLHLASGETYWVRDGSSLDSDPARDKILFCVETAYLDTNSHLLFDAPATVYLTDSRREGMEMSGITPAYLQLPGAVVQAQVNGAGLRNGVELVQRWIDPDGLPASGTGGLAFIGITGEFYGSIWAPESAVFLADDSFAAYDFFDHHQGSLTVPPVRVVASHVWLDSGANPASSFTFRAEPGDGSPAPRNLTVSLISWSLEPTPVGDTTVGHANPDDRAQVMGVGKTALKVTHDGLSYQSERYVGP